MTRSYTSDLFDRQERNVVLADGRKRMRPSMNNYEQKLVEFIGKNHISAEHLVFQTSCHSVEEAAASANANSNDFVKNVCIMNEMDNSLIVCIISGDKRLDLKKLATVIGTKKLRFATAEEILQKTGYPMGGTPSFGYSAKFFIDISVLTKTIVYSGGGSQNALTKVAPLEIIKFNNAEKADLTK